MSTPRIFASDIPPNVPEGWREAANWHLERTRDAGMVARLRKVIADARMVRFWEAADAAQPAPSRARMLAVLVAGAYAPPENPGEIMERRRALAGRVRALAEMIANDPDARQIDVEEMLHWTQPATEPPSDPDNQGAPMPRAVMLRNFQEGQGVWVQRPALVTDEARRAGMAPRFSDALQAMASRLESGKPICIFDPLERAPWATMREASATTRLVRTLAAETEHIRDAIGFDLIALAANVATCSDIDRSKAYAIWRDFLRGKRPE